MTVVSHASDHAPMSGNGSRLSCRKPVESATSVNGNRPISIVCDRITRDFEHGVSLRSIGKMYQQRVDVLEGILRDRLRELEAALRRAGNLKMSTGVAA